MSRTRATRSALTMTSLLALAIGCGGCFGKKETVFVEPGTPLKLMEPATARVMARRDGQWQKLPGKTVIPAGWIAVYLPEEAEADAPAD